MGPERLCLQKLPRAWKKRFLLRLFCYRLRVLRARSRNGLELIGDALAAPEVSQIPYSHLHKKKKEKRNLCGSSFLHTYIASASPLFCPNSSNYKLTSQRHDFA